MLPETGEQARLMTIIRTADHPTKKDRGPVKMLGPLFQRCRFFSLIDL